MAENVNKVDAARRQIETAIALTFDNGDVVSIHTLAAAANEILGDLCEKANLLSRVDQAWDDLIKPEHRQEAEQYFRRHANFFKHADRDPHDAIELFEDEVNDFYILWFTQRWRTLGHSLTHSMGVFSNWYIACNHQYLNTDYTNYGRFEFVGKKLKNIPRKSRLLFGQAMLRRAEGSVDELNRIILAFNESLPNGVDNWLAE